MKNKLMIYVALTLIAVGLIGSVALAAKGNNNIALNNKIKGSNRDIQDKINKNKESNINKDKDVEQKSYNYNDEYNMPCWGNSEIIDIMESNGLGNVAQYMVRGNFEEMDKFINNLSEEDYNKMLEIMRENGYGYMADRMETIGRDGMIERHNHMIDTFDGPRERWNNDFRQNRAN